MLPLTRIEFDEGSKGGMAFAKDLVHDAKNR